MSDAPPRVPKPSLSGALRASPAPSAPPPDASGTYAPAVASPGLPDAEPLAAPRLESSTPPDERAPEARIVRVRDVEIGNGRPFVLIAGPCQIESEAHAFEMADALSAIARAAGVPLIYKSSYDKANRTSGSAARGVGIIRGLSILAAVRERFRIPVLTDVHAPDQCDPAAEAVDILQIPAFLCRQTDLLLAAGETGRAINIKKGQFLAPWDMANVAAKIADTGNESILLTERGVSFGYNTLVTDFRGLPVMARSGYPVVFDATHSVQQPGGQGGSSGGQREFAPVLARAALAVGVAALFIEAHADPDHAPSDGPNMIPLRDMPALIEDLRALDDFMKPRLNARLQATGTPPR